MGALKNEVLQFMRCDNWLPNTLESRGSHSVQHKLSVSLVVFYFHAKNLDEPNSDLSDYQRIAGDETETIESNE